LTNIQKFDGRQNCTGHESMTLSDSEIGKPQSESQGSSNCNDLEVPGIITELVKNCLDNSSLLLKHSYFNKTHGKQ
jgi:hypothetical protein